MKVADCYRRVLEVRFAANDRGARLGKRPAATDRAREARALERDLWRDVLYAIATYGNEDPARELAGMALGTLGVEFDREA